MIVSHLRASLFSLVKYAPGLERSFILREMRDLRSLDVARLCYAGTPSRRADRPSVKQPRARPQFLAMCSRTKVYFDAPDSGGKYPSNGDPVGRQWTRGSILVQQA